MPKVLENPRGRILTAARELLIERGYGEFSVREVARRCEVAVGTIYNYFPTKQEMVIQVVLDYWEGYLTRLNAIDEEERDLYVKLERMYFQLESFMDTFRGVWMKVSVAEQDAFHPELRKQSHRDFVERLTRRLEEILLREAENGTVTLPLDAYEVAQFIMQNFLMMAQMKRFAYNSFDTMIRALLWR